MNTLSSLLNWIGETIGANPNTLATASKTIVGSINEVKANALTNASVSETGESGKLTRVASDGTLKMQKGNASGNLTVGGKLTVGGTLKVGGEDVVDYVIAQGVSGNWTYRKWKRGFLEQWGRLTVGANAGYVLATFPQAFKDTSYRVHVTGVYTTGQVAFSESAQISSATAANIYVRNSTGAIPPTSVNVNVYAAGDWK